MQGVVRGLIERGLLPRIIAGSSVGAIVAAIAALHNDDELHEMYVAIEKFNLSFFANNSLFQALGHYFSKGTLQGMGWTLYVMGS
jgi:TAG lipase / steryl ester hydrolase / phospholipase A2 / LPA acyltransferase